MTGTELGRAREALGLSQEELAQALEVGVQDVAEWERSDRIPRGLRYPLKLVLWQRACQVVLDGSGLPEQVSRRRPR